MEKDKVKQAAISILGVDKENKIIDNFAMKCFDKKFSDQRGQVWYNGYAIINKGNTIRVKYQYGGGDMEMDGHFDVEL